jgi:hypothetical protein
MPNLEDWEFRNQTGGSPRIVFGGQGDWLPTNATGSGESGHGYTSARMPPQMW